MKMIHAFLTLGPLTALMLILSVVSYNLTAVPDSVGLTLLIVALVSFVLIWVMLLVSSYSKS